jgi:hypothetical protein
MSTIAAGSGPPPTPSPASGHSTSTQPAGAVPAVPADGISDFAIIVVVAFFAAVLVRMYWKALLTIVIVVGLTFVFVGVFASVSMISAPK